MKRRVILAACAIVAACSSPEDMSDGIGLAEADPSAATGESAQDALDRRVAADAEAFSFSETKGDEQTGLREFSYSWPRQVSAIPQLAAAFEADYQREIALQRDDWAQAVKDCPEEFASCRNNHFSLEWQVVADTPRFLSLSSNIATYTGGAHGNYGRGAALWDREGEQKLEPEQLFTSPQALGEAIGASACEALNEERAKRRGAPVIRDAGDWSTACVPVEDTVLFLGSSNGAAFDRIGVYYGPYVAGPYAEGDFEFTLSVTGAVLEAVKPEYRSAFRPGQREAL
ncbi:MAG: DUF4163 domain-containing protein [Pseudomonadota bacterium]